MEKTNVYDSRLYQRGILPIGGEAPYIEARGEEICDLYSLILPMEYGKCYELHFPKTLSHLTVFSSEADPRALSVAEKIPARIIRQTENGGADLSGLLYIPQTKLEFLLVYMEKSEQIPITVFEHLMLSAKEDGLLFYKPKNKGGFLGKDGDFADYRYTSDEVFEKLYEPLRKSNPRYIRREHIGKDQSGSYDMYLYVFEPEEYEITAFLSAGMHANEEDAYFALAYFLEDVTNAKEADGPLYFLKTKVRFFVIPMINVYGIHQEHSVTGANWRIRYNFNKIDLNRDFADKSQAETKNVCRVLEKYGKEITFGIDFHTTPDENGSDLFFNFNVGSDNLTANLQATSHVYRRMVEEGMIKEDRKLLVPSSAPFGTLAAIDGKYAATRTLQSYLWNVHGIPPITVEYMNFTSGKSPEKGSASGLMMAAEILGSFVIPNAMLYQEKAKQKRKSAL